MPKKVQEVIEPEYSYELPQERMPESPAPLFRRAAAFIIDVLIFNIVLYPLFMKVFQGVSGLSNDLLTVEYVTLHPELLTAMFGVIISSSLILCFYMALSEYSFGETLGKHFMGLHVKGSAGLWGYVARNLLKSTFIILLPIDLIGLFLYNQRIIDKVLGINVLYTRRMRLTEGLI